MPSSLNSELLLIKSGLSRLIGELLQQSKVEFTMPKVSSPLTQPKQMFSLIIFQVIKSLIFNYFRFQFLILISLEINENSKNELKRVYSVVESDTSDVCDQEFSNGCQFSFT